MPRSPRRRRSSLRRRLLPRAPKLDARGVLAMALCSFVLASVVLDAISKWYDRERERIEAVARWAVPVALLLAALGLALLVRRWLRARRLRVVGAQVRARIDSAAPGDRTGRWLEERTAHLYSTLPGVATARVHGGAADRGMDVSAVTRSGLVVVTQCKQYSEDHKVGSQEMQTFLGTCWDILRVDGRLADVAVFVTTSSFTQEARLLASMPRQVRGQYRIVVLVDRDALVYWEAGLWSPLHPYITEKV